MIDKKKYIKVWTKFMIGANLKKFQSPEAPNYGK